MNRGKRSTAKRESDVNALAGVRSPPSNVNTPNETIVTRTGMLFSMNIFNCKKKGKSQKQTTIKRKYINNPKQFEESTT